MSSVRTDIGSSTSSGATLELGRQLAARFDNHDIVGRWMAHHLVELVTLAEHGSAITVDQRQEIVDLILKVWAHRRYYSGDDLLNEYSAILVVLERLGDDAPWKFLRLFDGHEGPDPGGASPASLRAAIGLADVARDTVIGLLWLATKDAEHNNEGLLAVADEISLTMESAVTRRLKRLRRMTSMRRRLPTEDVEHSDVEVEPPDLSLVDDEMINNDLADRLRRTADELNRIADEIVSDSGRLQ
jgi:hypothetical protein